MSLGGDQNTTRGFFPGNPVYVENNGSGPAWVPAKVTWVKVPISYEFSMDRGLIWCHHINQLCRRVLLDVEDSTRSAIGLESEPSLSEDHNSPSGPQSLEEEVSLANVSNTPTVEPAETPSTHLMMPFQRLLLLWCRPAN